MVLIQECGKPVIQARIVRVPTDLAAEHRQSAWDLLLLNESAEIAFQHARVLGGTRAHWNCGRSRRPDLERGIRAVGTIALRSFRVVATFFVNAVGFLCAA